MRIYRLLLALTPVAGLVLLTGALRNPDSDETPPLPPEFTALLDAPADPAAEAAVARALAELSDPARPWLQTGVTIRSRIPELLFRGEGTFSRATGQRFRLEVRTRLDDPVAEGAESTFFALSDGRDLWQATLTSKQEWRDMQRLALGVVRVSDVAPALLGSPALRGPEQMLRSIGRYTAWVRVRPEGDDREVVGVWLPAVKASILANRHEWPVALPRLYRLRLTGPHHWPGRLEWWGPNAPDGPDRLLAEVEFAPPVRDRVLTEEQCARLYTFTPVAAAQSPP